MQDNNFRTANPAHPLRFFFNDTATTEIYTLSLHDALPIFFFCTFVSHDGGSGDYPKLGGLELAQLGDQLLRQTIGKIIFARSEEHTSELQSRLHLACRLLLDKKKPLCLNVRS